MPAPVNNSTPSSKNPEDGIGDRIRAVREQRGLSQSQLHQRTKERDPDGKGIGRTVLIGYESGKFKPGARELRILCATLSLQPGWLLLGSESDQNEDLEAASAALLTGIGEPGLSEVFRLALVLLALKQHERESLGTLIHGLASARKGAPTVGAISSLADWMASDAELRLVELTGSFDAADSLRFFKGKKLIEHFSELYEQAYKLKFLTSPR